MSNHIHESIMSLILIEYQNEAHYVKKKKNLR